MKKAEYVLVAIAALSAILDLMNVKAFNPVVVMSMSGLALFYMIKIYEPLIKEKGWTALLAGKSAMKMNSVDKVITVMKDVSVSVSIIGILFTLQLWPGSKIQLQVGLVALLCATVLMIVMFNKTQDKKYTVSLKRNVIYLIIGTAIYFTPEMTWVEAKYKDHPSYIEALKNAREHPQDEELQQIREQEYFKMKSEEGKGG